MGMGKIGVDELKPVVLMVMVQSTTAGQNILYELAGNDGMDMRVLVAYRLLFASAFMVPLALYVERNKRPKLTWMVLCQAFFGGLFGASLSQNLYAKSLVMTSATFASAMTNIVPAITLILAVFCRLETLGLGTTAGKAKVVGTVMSIGGALLLTFYKGVVINIWSTNIDLLNQGGHAATSDGGSNDHVLGCVLLILACAGAAAALIVQTKMSKAYPCHYSSTALMALMGSVQAVVFALCSQRNWEEWKLGWNVRLLTVSYSGILASGIMIIFTMWCVHKKGPLFASIFNPLVLVIVAIVGSLILDEKLHLGSVLGGVVIVCGLYVVLWGKSKETSKIAQLIPSKSLSDSQKIEIVVSENYKKSNSHKSFRVAPEILPIGDDKSEEVKEGVPSSK